MRLARLLCLAITLATSTLAVNAQAVRVISVSSDPTGNTCTATTPATILAYSSGSTITWYYCNTTPNPDVWAAVVSGSGDMTQAVYDTNADSEVDSAALATALAANGSNCSAGNAPLGVDASGAVESCTDFEEDLSNSAGLAAAVSDETGTGVVVFGTDPTIDARGGTIRTPEATSEGTCTSSNEGAIKRVNVANTPSYSAICSDDGDGTYSWQKATHDASPGWVPVEFYTQTVYTVAVGPPLKAYPIGALRDGLLYGRGPGGAGTECTRIYSSSDGVTWSEVSDGTATFSGCPNNIMDLAGGEVGVTTPNGFYKSTSWGGTETWTLKQAPSSGSCADSDFLGWAMDTCPECGSGYVTLSEYNAETPFSCWDSSDDVYLSTDNGETFSVVYQLSVSDPGQNNHLHGTAIDPWAWANGSPRLWFSWHRQDATDLGFMYSDDAGSTWTELDAKQPTTIRAARYGVFIGTDYNPEGFQIVRRTSTATDMVVENSGALPWEFNTAGFSRKSWRDHRDDVVYDVYGGQVADSLSFVGVSDGATSSIVEWYFPDTTGTDEVTYDGVYSVGEKMVVAYDDNGTSKYYVTRRPDRGTPPFDFYNTGNLFPSDQDTDNTSLAAGIGSSADATDGTSVGYRSNVDDTDATCVGSKCSTAGARSTLIGAGASGAQTTDDDSVGIGDAVQVEFESTVIGSGASGGDYSVCIGGGNITCNDNTTVGGYGVTVSGARCTVWGKGGSCTHADSVALGETSATQATNQVSVGPRSIAQQEMSAAPSDAAGYGQTWIRNDAPNTLMWTDDTGQDYAISEAPADAWGNFRQAWMPYGGASGVTASSPVSTTAIRLFEYHAPTAVKFDRISINLFAASTGTTIDCSLCVAARPSAAGVLQQVACATTTDAQTDWGFGTTGRKDIAITSATIPAGFVYVGLTCDDASGISLLAAGSNGGAYIQRLVPRSDNITMTPGTSPSTITLTAVGWTVAATRGPWFELWNNAGGAK